MLKLLKQHIEETYQTFQSNADDISILLPYLKSPEITTLPLDVIEFPLYIPDMLQELVDFMIDTSTDEQFKALASSIYSYVFNPFDYIADTSETVIGFLDDALIVFYGLQLIEDSQTDQFFKSIHQPKIINAVCQCEDLLSESILSLLKSFPLEVNKIIEINE